MGFTWLSTCYVSVCQNENLLGLMCLGTPGCVLLVSCLLHHHVLLFVLGSILLCGRYCFQAKGLLPYWTYPAISQCLREAFATVTATDGANLFPFARVVAALLTNGSPDAPPGLICRERTPLPFRAMLIRRLGSPRHLRNWAFAT